MSVKFEDPRGNFLRRVSRVEARAHSPLNAPNPRKAISRQNSWLDNRVSALFLGMLVLVAVRILLFHFPEIAFQAHSFGLLPGMAGAYVLPLMVALLVSWFAGHFSEEYWVPSLAGIGMALFFEQFIMLIFPDVWGLAYSPEFVTFVGEGAGSLHSWLDSVQATVLAQQNAVTEPQVLGLAATAATE